MKVRIDNLPADASEDDIRELLDQSDDIRSIELIAADDAEHSVAVVDMDGDAAAEGVIQIVDGRHWKDATLRADKLLY